MGGLKPRELHTNLVSPMIAAPVVVSVWAFSNAATADATVQGPKMTRKVRLVRASYQQTADAEAATSFTLTLMNGAVALTSALDIDALGATAGADFVITTVDNADILADGDVITAVFNETGGTVTAPGQVAITLELQLLS
jgi:hypothetical protein